MLVLMRSTEIDRTEEWTYEGMSLGYRRHVEPWRGTLSWATVNLDTGTVIAVDDVECVPHLLISPENEM